MVPRYQVLSHTADTGVITYGATLAEVFENAAFAMFDLMFGIGELAAEERIRIEVEAPTLEDLLVDWLSTLLFEAETRELALCLFEIEDLEESRLSAWVGGLASAARELTGPPVKAVTYHGLLIGETPGGYEARVIFDV